MTGLTLLHNDILLRILRFLPYTSKNKAGITSQLLYILSREAQRDAQAVTLVGSLHEIATQLRDRLASAPTFVIVTVDREVVDVQDELTAFLKTLPLHCPAIAACTPSFGWGDTTPNGVFSQPFSEYEYTPPRFALYAMSLADTVSSGCDFDLWTRDNFELRDDALQDLPPNANTLFVAASRQILSRFDEAVSALGKKFGEAHVVGGIVEEKLLVKHKADVKLTRLAAIVLSSQNAYAVSTRGVEAVSDDLEIAAFVPAESHMDDDDVDSDSGGGTNITHLAPPGETHGRCAGDVFVSMYHSLRVQCAPVYFGIKTQRHDGYELNNVDARSVECGSLRVSSDRVQTGMRCKFFQLRRKACVADIDAKMKALKEEARKLGDTIAGCIMVSCCARDEHMMSVPTCDGRLFHQACPEVPFLGMFVAGEIGPPTVAESATVFTKGKAELLGHACCMLVFIVNPDKEGSPFYQAFERGEISMAHAVKALARS